MKVCAFDIISLLYQNACLHLRQAGPRSGFLSTTDRASGRGLLSPRVAVGPLSAEPLRALGWSRAAAVARGSSAGRRLGRRARPRGGSGVQAPGSGRGVLRATYAAYPTCSCTYGFTYRPLVEGAYRHGTRQASRCDLCHVGGGSVQICSR